MSDAYNLKVATVLTACGIETFEKTPKKFLPSLDWLQQYLPLAVLKHVNFIIFNKLYAKVATVLTACGIETRINLVY